MLLKVNEIAMNEEVVNHNLPEPSTSSVQEEIRADTKTTEGIIKDKLSISDVKILM